MAHPFTYKDKAGKGLVQGLSRALLKGNSPVIEEVSLIE
jgi:hypothetical protein